MEKKPFDLEAAKKQLHAFEDLAGFGLLNKDDIDDCKTKEDLSDLVDHHIRWLEGWMQETKDSAERSLFAIVPKYDDDDYDDDYDADSYDREEE